ncbi:MAG: GGDEF domain-containing protein [Clostridiales bacterium]|nr:GGDEF domain-containing protein [Clostridiales bacterium]
MRKRLLIDLNLAICVILLIFIVFLFLYELDGGNLNSKDEQFSDGWTYEDGTPVDFSNLRYEPEAGSITKTISPEQVSGADLCFESRSLFFTVYVNDTAVYDFHPDLIRIYGNYYGECIHTVDLPALEENSVIRIDYSTLHEAKTSTFYFMKIQEGASFVRGMITANFANYIQCFVILVLGVVLIVVGFLFTADPNSVIETISLGTTAIVLALWTSSGSRIPQLISANSAMVRVMDYMCLIFLPVPVIILIASVSKQLESKLPKILIGLCGLNLVLNIVWVLALGRDYSEILFITHIILGIGVLFTIHLTIGAYKKSGKFGKNMKVIVAGFSVLIAAGILDVVRYYLLKASDASLFTRLGLLYFIILFTIYELNLFLNIIRKSAQTEVMEKLAYNDGLTGLLNRLAFTQEENRIKEKESGKYVLVQLDINFLKQVNDNYGHAEGDRFIIAAAELINDTFGRYGKCYRIGGDEFFAILNGKHSEEDYDKAAELFEEKIKEVNDRNEFHIPLCIAYGKAVYVPGTSDFDETEKEADKLMYENKKILKAAGYQAK